jgi:pyridoxal phosphate phosphatase PHOSPHO2
MPSPTPFKPVKTQLLISDFDESFSDADTDRWVFEVLSPKLRRKFEEIGLTNTMQFTDMCASLLVELHKEGKSPEDIINAQKKVYVHPAMVRGVKNLKSQASPKTECFLLSNSNEVYLKTVLEVSEMLPRSLCYYNSNISPSH